jgi:hypothetical protein
VANYWYSMGEWAVDPKNNKMDLELAAKYFEQALQYDPHNSSILLKLKLVQGAQKYERQAEARTAAEARAEEQRAQQANPNYPAPPPVYRDANTPRDYPDLPSYSATQKKAHSDNELGNIWAQKVGTGAAQLSAGSQRRPRWAVLAGTEG